jgi:ubiquinone/menaquinone biosynthesis C-methylase UbiE
MESLLDAVRAQGRGILSPQALGTFVRGIDVAALDLSPWRGREAPAGGYVRETLLTDPLEVTVLVWPPGGASAIHHHAGFFGHVLVVEGRMENIEYRLKDGVLTDTLHAVFGPGGVAYEPDGMHHLIRNADPDATLLTIHFYSPPLTSMAGLKILDPATGTIATLNEQAKSASFKEPRAHFAEVQEGVFTYLPFAEKPGAPSHHIFPIVPKPGPARILELVKGYYDEQAAVYDRFDLQHDSRRPFTERVNALVAEVYARQDTLAHELALACGTGRRSCSIREASGRDYAITGVDISGAMSDIASERGIEAINAPFLEAKVPEGAFDVCSILYAFGHVPTDGLRRQWLRKIHRCLRPEGRLVLDLFNLEDRNEWGPAALRAYERMALGEQGYERGDVFYQRTGGKEVAFLHYFTEQGARQLLREEGFRVERILHVGYVHRSGEILQGKDQGALFVEAVRV